MRQSTHFLLLLCAALLCLAAEPKNSGPSIDFTVVPPTSGGNANRVDRIEGRVRGSMPGQRIVLYAQTDRFWWLQPAISRPFTEIQPDSHWKNVTHPGLRYAALLVDAQYRPLAKINELPGKSGSVLAVATAVSKPAAPDKILQFSGYPWRLREGGRMQSGQINFYEPANAWTDRGGSLHLRVTQRDGQWLGAEVTLNRSLGYGSYRFVLRDISHLEPAAVLIAGPSAKLAVEFSRWGLAEDKNAQYVIAPYNVPANTFRFLAPGGRLTHWIEWQPERVTFRTGRGQMAKADRDAVAEHAFTSGIQPPGNEGVCFNLYALDNPRNPLKQPFEVIVDKFEFLP